MIRGQVNAAHDAVIPLRIRASDGQTRDLDAVVDTGFSGYLTLLKTDIEALNLPFQQRQTYVVGDNRRVTFDVHLATVVWDGQDRDIAVLAAESGTLVGMRMLRGFRLCINVVDGGEVHIEAQQ